MFLVNVFLNTGHSLELYIYIYIMFFFMKEINCFIHSQIVLTEKFLVKVE